jgi:methionyl-tRNA formyltransferase
VLKIFRATKTAEKADNRVGALRADRKHLFIACEDCWLRIDELQLAGKKRMDAQAFLNGMKEIEKYSAV